MSGLLPYPPVRDKSTRNTWQVPLERTTAFEGDPAFQLLSSDALLRRRPVLRLPICLGSGPQERVPFRASQVQGHAGPCERAHGPLRYKACKTMDLWK